jgi:hypothetical protein
MAGVRRNYGDESRFDDFAFAIDGDFEFAFYYFIDFFLWMGVFVDGGALSEFVVGECHGRRMEVPSVPTGQALGFV